MNVLYRFYTARDRLLYVGITCDPPRRFREHEREKVWWALVARISLAHYDSRGELEAAETAAIRSERPRFNVVGAVAPTVLCAFCRGPISLDRAADADVEWVHTSCAQDPLNRTCSSCGAVFRIPPGLADDPIHQPSVCVECELADEPAERAA